MNQMEYMARYIATNLLWFIVLADITFSTEALTVVGGLLTALTGAVVFLFKLLNDLHGQRLKAMEAEKLAIIEIIRSEHAAAVTALKAEHTNTMTTLAARLERMEVRLVTYEQTLKEIRAEHVDCVERAARMEGKLQLLAEQEAATRTRVDQLENPNDNA
jgi:hypothetical protein